MKDSDAVQVIQKLEEALNIIRRHDGQLSAQAVRTKTMIAIARSEVAQLLSDGAAKGPAAALFERPPSSPPFAARSGPTDATVQAHGLPVFR